MCIRDRDQTVYEIRPETFPESRVRQQRYHCLRLRRRPRPNLRRLRLLPSLRRRSRRRRLINRSRRLIDLRRWRWRRSRLINRRRSRLIALHRRAASCAETRAVRNRRSTFRAKHRASSLTANIRTIRAPPPRSRTAGKIRRPCGYTVRRMLGRNAIVCKRRAANRTARSNVRRVPGRSAENHLPLCDGERRWYSPATFQAEQAELGKLRGGRIQMRDRDQEKIVGG